MKQNSPAGKQPRLQGREDPILIAHEALSPHNARRKSARRTERSRPVCFNEDNEDRAKALPGREQKAGKPNGGGNNDLRPSLPEMYYKDSRRIYYYATVKQKSRPQK